MALRKLYQRVIGLPIDSLEKEWKEYEAFEMSLSEHLAKNKFIPENLPRYQAAKTVLKERKQVRCWCCCCCCFISLSCSF